MKKRDGNDGFAWECAGNRLQELIRMDSSFIKRIIRTSLVTGSLITLFLLTYRFDDFRISTAFLAGVLWSAANLKLIQILAEAGTALWVPTAGGRQLDKKRLALLMLFKFPVLYGTGVFLALHPDLVPPAPLLAGFTLPFVVAALKSLSLWMLERFEGTEKKD